MCWCNPSYNAQRKNIEQEIPSISIQAILADNNLQSYINTIDNPQVKIWKTVIKEHKLERERL